MLERHWNEIIEKTGLSLKISENMTFEELLENNI